MLKLISICNFLKDLFSELDFVFLGPHFQFKRLNKGPDRHLTDIVFQQLAGHADYVLQILGLDTRFMDSSGTRRTST